MARSTIQAVRSKTGRPEYAASAFMTRNSCVRLSRQPLWGARWALQLVAMARTSLPPESLQFWFFSGGPPRLFADVMWVT
jgi:hypothetical protein